MISSGSKTCTNATDAPYRLFFQRSARRINDAILSRDVKISVHRQADDLGREAVAHGHALLADWIMFVRLLTMQRDRVVNGGRNAISLEKCRKFVAPAVCNTDGVLSPDRGRTRRHDRHSHDIAEPFA